MLSPSDEEHDREWKPIQEHAFHGRAELDAWMIRANKPSPREPAIYRFKLRNERQSGRRSSALDVVHGLRFNLFLRKLVDD